MAKRNWIGYLQTRSRIVDLAEAKSPLLAVARAKRAAGQVEGAHCFGSRRAGTKKPDTAEGLRVSLALAGFRTDIDTARRVHAFHMSHTLRTRRRVKTTLGEKRK
jgi:hypothetical protein